MIRPTLLHEALDHSNELGLIGQGLDGALIPETSVRAHSEGREVLPGQLDFVDVFVTGAQRSVGKPKHPSGNAGRHVVWLVLEAKT